MAAELIFDMGHWHTVFIPLVVMVARSVQHRIHSCWWFCNYYNCHILLINSIYKKKLQKYIQKLLAQMWAESECDFYLYMRHFNSIITVSSVCCRTGNLEGHRQNKSIFTSRVLLEQENITTKPLKMLRDRLWMWLQKKKIALLTLIFTFWLIYHI